MWQVVLVRRAGDRNVCDARAHVCERAVGMAARGRAGARTHTAARRPIAVRRTHTSASQPRDKNLVFL